MLPGSGSWTRIASTFGSAFRRPISARSIASVTVAGKRSVSARIPASRALFSLFRT